MDIVKIKSPPLVGRQERKEASMNYFFLYLPASSLSLLSTLLFLITSACTILHQNVRVLTKVFASSRNRKH